MDLEKVNQNSSHLEEKERIEFQNEVTTYLTKEQILQLSQKPYIDKVKSIGTISNSFYAKTKSFLINDQFEKLKGDTGKEEGYYTIIKGTNLDKKDLNDESNVTISSKYAELNNLKINDFIEIKMYKNHAIDNENFETIGILTYQLKINEIYNIENEPSQYEIDEAIKGGGGENSQKVFIYSNKVNTLEISNEFLEKTINDENQMIEEYNKKNNTLLNKNSVKYDNYFFLKSNNDFESFKKDVSSIVGKTSYLKGVTNGSQFIKVVEPLKSLESIATITLFSSIIFLILILGIVIIVIIHERKYEIGLYYSLGFSKFKIIKQLFLGILFITLVAITFSLIISNKLSNTVSDNLLQTKKIQNEKESTIEDDEFRFSVYGNASNVYINETSFNLNYQIIMLFYFISILIIMISIMMSSLYILRMSPKKIMFDL